MAAQDSVDRIAAWRSSPHLATEAGPPEMVTEWDVGEKTMVASRVQPEVGEDHCTGQPMLATSSWMSIEDAWNAMCTELGACASSLRGDRVGVSALGPF